MGAGSTLKKEESIRNWTSLLSKVYPSFSIGSSPRTWFGTEYELGTRQPNQNCHTRWIPWRKKVDGHATTIYELALGVTRQLLDAYCALFPTIFDIFLLEGVDLFSVRNSRCFYPQMSGFASISNRRSPISPSSHVPTYPQASGSFLRYEWSRQIKCRGIILSFQAKTTWASTYSSLHNMCTRRNKVTMKPIQSNCFGALHSTKSMCLVATALCCFYGLSCRERERPLL